MIPLIWTVLAVVGLVLATVAMREASRIYLSTSGITNGRRATAWVGFLTELIRWIVYGIFFAVGVWFMAQDRDVAITWVGIAFLVVEALTVIKSIINLWLTRYLIRTELARLAESPAERNAREDLVMGDQRRDWEDEHAADVAAVHAGEIKAMEGEHADAMAAQHKEDTNP